MELQLSDVTLKKCENLRKAETVVRVKFLTCDQTSRPAFQ